VTSVKGLDGNGLRTVPEGVKDRRELLHHGAVGHYVVVAELRFGIDLEVLIANVPATDQGKSVVRDHELVVHSVVQPTFVYHEVECPKKPYMPSVLERIEYADLNQRMGRQGEELLVACDALSIVH
jgi:hypothetical protein